MLFRTPGRLTRTQILIVGIVGVLGGVYTWKPVFERAARQEAEKLALQKQQQEQQQLEELKD